MGSSLLRQRRPHQGLLNAEQTEHPRLKPPPRLGTVLGQVELIEPLEITFEQVPLTEDVTPRRQVSLSILLRRNTYRAAGFVDPVFGVAVLISLPDCACDVAIWLVAAMMAASASGDWPASQAINAATRP